MKCPGWERPSAKSAGQSGADEGLFAASLGLGRVFGSAALGARCVTWGCFDTPGGEGRLRGGGWAGLVVRMVAPDCFFSD